MKRSYRAVEETDQLRAGQIDYVAKETLSLHGENALLTAEELVKVDGEQIHARLREDHVRQHADDGHGHRASPTSA